MEINGLFKLFDTHKMDLECQGIFVFLLSWEESVDANHNLVLNNWHITFHEEQETTDFLYGSKETILHEHQHLSKVCT